jgi:hypothetical protein
MFVLICNTKKAVNIMEKTEKIKIAKQNKISLLAQLP